MTKRAKLAVVVSGSGPSDGDGGAPPSTLEAVRPDLMVSGDSWLSRLRVKMRGKLFRTGLPRMDPGGSTKREPPSVRLGNVERLPQQVGRYQILGRIGSGGMGVIYSATDPALGRKVAVKLLNPSESERGTEGRARMVREAKALAKLSHAAVIQVYEVGTFEDQVFIAMEFVEGQTLRSWQKDSERPWRAVLGAYVLAASGLAAAHEAGIVHRDFKPDNVLVRPDGQVRVIDFGLARTDADAVRTAVPEFAADQPADAALTRTGTLMGTPAYMAPEQFRGDPADPRTDQFAFCIALYEALYGYRPFAGASVHQVAEAVMKGRFEAPPRYTDVPERVHRVLQRGLAANADHRYPDLRALIDDLPGEPTRSLRWAVGAIFVGALVAGAVAFGLSGRGEEQVRDAADRATRNYERQRIAATEEELRKTRQRRHAERWNELVIGSAERAVHTDPTRALALLKHIDPEGRDWLAPARLIAGDAVDSDFVSHQIEPSVGRIEHLVIAQGGDIVAAASDEGVYRWTPRTFAFQKLAGPENKVVTIAIAENGDVIAAGGPDGAWVWANERGPAQRLSAAPRDVVAIALSQTGANVAVGGRDGEVRLIDWASGNSRAARKHKAAIIDLSIAAGDDMLASASVDGLIRLWFLGEDKRWEITHRGGARLRAIEFGSRGTYLDCLGHDGMIWRLRTDEQRGRTLDDLPRARWAAPASWGAGVVLAPADEAPVVSFGPDVPVRRLGSHRATAVAMSPDGQDVAVSTVAGSLEVWSVEPPEDPLLRVHDGSVLALAFGPDGKRLAAGTSSGAVRTWNLDTDEAKSIGHLLGGVHELSFAPMGDRLAALGGLGGITVWRLRDEAEPMTLSPSATVEPPLRWSPDGSFVAVEVCDTPRRCAAVVHSLTEGRVRLSTPLGAPLRSLALSPAAMLALLVRGDGRRVELYGVDLEQTMRPAWPRTPDGPVVAHVFADNGWIRLATQSDDGVELWEWDPTTTAVASLEQRRADSIVVDRDRRTILLRQPYIDELWSIDSAFVRAVSGLPDRVEELIVSPDEQRILVRDGERIVVAHIDSGATRTLVGLAGPTAWSGDGDFASVEAYSRVRLLADRTPREPESFRAWLDDLTTVRVGRAAATQ